MIFYFSKIEAGSLQLEMKEVNLHLLVQQVVNMLKYELEKKGLLLELELDPQLIPWCYVDELRLKQVLTNLLSNALKFTVKGKINLRISTQTLEPDRARYHFEVEDTGIGISKAQQQQLFQPFAQADISTTRNFGGTGLGLAIAKMLVEEMGGEMQLESKLGQGSCFSFFIDCQILSMQEKASAQQFVKIPMSVDRLEEAELQLLIVDDVKMNIQLVRTIVKKMMPNAIVYTAQNGEEAIALAQQQAFDLILVDIQMPVMNGYEATKVIRTLDQHQTTPIIAFTAGVIRGEQERCFKVGMNAYLKKPVEMEQFKETIQAFYPN